MGSPWVDVARDSMTLLPVDMRTDTMPKALRSNLLATVTLATTVSVSGCIFPFTRGGQTNIDDKVAELAAEGPAEKAEPQLADLPALNAPGVQNQPTEIAQAPQGKKQLPPFARFLNNMLGGGSSQPQPTASPNTTAAPTVAAQPQPAPAAPPATAEITPAATLMADQSKPSSTPETIPAPPKELPPVVRVEDLSAAERQAKPTANQGHVQVVTQPKLPIVIVPKSNPAAETTDVVSKFAAKATKIVEGTQSEEERQPPQPKSAPQIAVQPTPEGSTLDAMARSPWNESSLLKKAKANSSSETTTLIHALDRALESVGKEETNPAVTTSPKAPQVVATTSPTPEPVAPSTPPEAKTATPQTVALPEPRFASRFTPPAQTPSGTKNLANPLRSGSGKTDWSGRSSGDTSQQPKTIVNNKFSEPTMEPSRSSQWSATLEPEPQTETTRKGAQVVAALPPAPAKPATTVNPYATEGSTERKEAAIETTPPTPRTPQMITNQMAAPSKKSVAPKKEDLPKIITTNTIHFESSVVNKLQAAHQLTNWDFEPPAPEEQLPQIVEGKEEPKVEAPTPQPAPIPTIRPRTTINTFIERAPQPSIPVQPAEPKTIEPKPAAPQPEEPKPTPQPITPQPQASVPNVPEASPEQAPAEQKPVPPTPVEAPAVEPAAANANPAAPPVVEPQPAPSQPTSRFTNPAGPAFRPQVVRPPAMQQQPTSDELLLEPTNPAVNSVPEVAPQPVAEKGIAKPLATPVPAAQAEPAAPQAFRPMAVTPPSQTSQRPVSPSTPTRGVLIRPAEPAPLGTSSSSGPAWRPTPVPVNKAPAKLAPVIRAAEGVQNAAPGQSAKTYIID